MAGNIFQQRITPVKPKVIETQQIFVYVEEATYDKAGIASFTNEHFIVNNGKVELATLKLSSDPFNKPSLIQLDKNDFKVNNRITSINWPYAYKGTDNANTNGWGLVKIGENSIGWLKYDANNLLVVDTDKVKSFVDEKIAPIVADVDSMKSSIDTAVALVDANNKLVIKLNSDFINLDTKVSTYDDAIASKLNKNKNYAVPGLTISTTIKNGDTNGEILLETEYNNLEGKFGKSRLVLNETGVYIGHVDTDTPITLEKIATEPYVQNELSKLTFIHILNTSSQLVITATSDTVQSVATKYVQDNYGRDPQQWDGLVITMTDSNNDKILYTYTKASQMWLNVGINNVDLTDYVSKDGISDININYGEETVLYDTTDGITITSNGQIKYKDNTVHQITTEYNLPIIAGDNITIDATSTNNKIVISAKGGEGIKTFTGRGTSEGNDAFFAFLQDLAPGDYFWLNGLSGNVITPIAQYSTVTGKILMQLVDGPSSYVMPGSTSLVSKTSKVKLINCFKLLAKGLTYTDTARDLKGGSFASTYNTIHKYNLTADLDDTKEYELYFAERMEVDNKFETGYAYSFVGVSTKIDANKSHTRVLLRLDATTAITENNEQAVTSGAVYTALQGKQATLTTAQLSAVNSGITSEKVTQIETNATNITLKQDKLTAGENITIENNVISAKGSDLTNYYTKTQIDTMLSVKVDKSVTYKVDESSTDTCTQEIINTNDGVGLSSSLGDEKPKSLITLTPTTIANLLYGKGDTTEIVQCSAAYGSDTGSTYRIDVMTTDTATSRTSTSTLLIDKEGVSISTDVGTGTSNTIYINDLYISSNTDNIIDLGTPTARFKNLYLAGNLSDGTNQVSIANIAKGQIKTIIYDNTTLKDHLTEIIGYTNIENGGTLLSIGFKTGTASVLANATKVVMANSVSPVVSTASQVVLKPGTFYSFRSADIESNKLTLNGPNGIDGCSSTNVEITATTCSMDGCGSTVNTDGAIETICFKSINLLEIPLEHLVIDYFTV